MLVRFFPGSHELQVEFSEANMSGAEVLKDADLRFAFEFLCYFFGQDYPISHTDKVHIHHLPVEDLVSDISAHQVGLELQFIGRFSNGSDDAQLLIFPVQLVKSRPCYIESEGFQTATLYSLSAELRLVFLSVDSLRLPMISAQLTW